jgi:hypothetical protein
MAAERVVPGSPYSAKLIESSNANEDCSFAEAVIEPPVMLGKNKNMFNTLFYTPLHKTSVSHLLTTMSKTVIEIRVDSEGSTDLIHDARMQLAYEGLSEFVGVLNQIENGTYNGV